MRKTPTQSSDVTSPEAEKLPLCFATLGGDPL